LSESNPISTQGEAKWNAQASVDVVGIIECYELKSNRQAMSSK